MNDEHSGSSRSILKAFRDDGYRLGACSVKLYNRHDISAYGTNFLHHLYCQFLDSAPNRPHGTLHDSFPGISDLSPDGICSYLASRQLVLLCVDRPPTHPHPELFDIAGIAYVVIFCGPPATLETPLPPRSAFCGYAFFRPWWGTPEMEVLGMLGLSYLFLNYNLQAIHGQRYHGNRLTAKFMSRFGFRDTGVVPRYMMNGDKLVDCTVSSLLREQFEVYVEKTLLGLGAESDGGERRRRK